MQSRQACRRMVEELFSRCIHMSGHSGSRGGSGNICRLPARRQSDGASNIQSRWLEPQACAQWESVWKDLSLQLSEATAREAHDLPCDIEGLLTGTRRAAGAR